MWKGISHTVNSGYTPHNGYIVIIENMSSSVATPVRWDAWHAPARSEPRGAPRPARPGCCDRDRRSHAGRADPPDLDARARGRRDVLMGRVRTAEPFRDQAVRARPVPPPRTPYVPASGSPNASKRPPRQGARLLSRPVPRLRARGVAGPEHRAPSLVPRAFGATPTARDPHSVSTSINRRQWSLGPHSCALLRARTFTRSWNPREAMA